MPLRQLVLTVAVTAGMTTARCLICMTAGAAFTAVVFAIFLDSLADIHNAQAGFTGTFHLSHSRHDRHFLLSDPNRWRILSALAIQEISVGDLAAVVAMSESAVSHQLRILRNSRLVKYRKQGRHVFYSLKDHHILNLYRDVSEHLDEPQA